MKDGIIKAEGNSRLVRSVADFKTKYPIYDDFAGALVAGTLPLDILFNAEGWAQLPNFLNKAALLKDATAALFGFTAEQLPDVVPDDVLALLKTLVDDAKTVANEKAKIQFGSYVGTGTYNTTRNTLTFADVPKIVFIFEKTMSNTYYGYYIIAAYSMTNALCCRSAGANESGITVNLSWNGNNMSWYGAPSAAKQLNISGNTYLYVAIL